MVIYCRKLTATSIVVQDSILSDTTWNVDTVKVNCNILIDTTATLTTEPGIIVEFQDHYILEVKGKLLAVSQPADNIIFTTCDTTGYNNNSHMGRSGIKFYNNHTKTDTSKLIYCNIEYAKNMQSYPD